MELIDNLSVRFGDDLKSRLAPGAKVRIAASCFSIYAYEALKAELEQIDSLEFIFTSPTFLPEESTDRARKDHREFHIPKRSPERDLYGSDFEVRLRNELTQRAIAKECADWMRRKATFRSNRGRTAMQQFATVSTEATDHAYYPLQGFTAVDLGYEQGDAVSNLITRIDQRPQTTTFLNLFDQVWKDPTKLEDVTDRLREHIASVYQENAPERIYFLILYNIFTEFLQDISTDVLPDDRTGYQDSLIWNKLFNFQRDAATGTPVGNYNPDWAIAFQQGTVKHVYFVAETKGSMSSMDLRKIEESKIACAKKFFARITTDQVKYDMVDSYGKLMELVS